MKNRGAFNKDLAPASYCTPLKLWLLKSMRSELSLEKKLRSYLSYIIFYENLKSRMKNHFLLIFHVKWYFAPGAQKSAPRPWLLGDKKILFKHLQKCLYHSKFIFGEPRCHRMCLWVPCMDISSGFGKSAFDL